MQTGEAPSAPDLFLCCRCALLQETVARSANTSFGRLFRVKVWQPLGLGARNAFRDRRAQVPRTSAANPLSVVSAGKTLLLSARSAITDRRSESIPARLAYSAFFPILRVIKRQWFILTTFTASPFWTGVELLVASYAHAPALALGLVLVFRVLVPQSLFLATYGASTQRRLQPLIASPANPALALVLRMVERKQLLLAALSTLTERSGKKHVAVLTYSSLFLMVRLSWR